MTKFCQTACLAEHFTVDPLFRPLSKQFQTVSIPKSFEENVVSVKVYGQPL